MTSQILENRRARVRRLMALALADKNPVKYIQGSFIISEIEKRENENTQFRNIFINQIRYGKS